MRTFTFVFGIACSVALWGCTANTEPNASEGSVPEGAREFPVEKTVTAIRQEAPGPNGETMFTETVVHLNADGTQTVKQRPISLAEELRDNAQREALAGKPESGFTVESITVDSGCGWTDYQAYDQAGNVGNKLCLTGTGAFDLNSVAHNCWIYLGHTQCISWGYEMASYWTGDTNGYMSNELPMSSCASPTDRCNLFLSGQSHDVTTSSCEHTHSVVHRPSSCQPPVVVQDGWQPFAFHGTYFTPNGQIGLQLWNSDYTKTRGTTFGYADSTGAYEWALGNTNSWDTTTSCGEHAVMIDETSGYSATALLTGACFQIL